MHLELLQNITNLALLQTKEYMENYLRFLPNVAPPYDALPSTMNWRRHLKIKMWATQFTILKICNRRLLVNVIKAPTDALRCTTALGTSMSELKVINLVKMTSIYFDNNLRKSRLKRQQQCRLWK